MKLVNFSNIFFNSLNHFKSCMDNEDFEKAYNALKKYTSVDLDKSNYNNKVNNKNNKTTSNRRQKQKYIKEAMYIRHLYDVGKNNIASRRKTELRLRLFNNNLKEEINDIIQGK